MHDMISIPGYKIIRSIGRGGMAEVYLAYQESVGRNVAIKVMSPALASDPSFSERFLKEARMANLSHPHIITVYDAGVIEGQNYIVMEYANGGNLDNLIHAGISVQRALEIIKQIASALNYSSDKGFIHRDVKPENILIREDGSAVLVDFGIAKAITSGTRLTMVGSTIGSPNYMSPEQARGLELDGRSDLYSLGIVFYECLTGTKPFDAGDTYVIGLKHINDPVPRLPGKLALYQLIIDKLLAKLPEERFANGRALIEAIDNLAQTNGSTAESESKPARQANTDADPTLVATKINDATVPMEANDVTRQLTNGDSTRVKPRVIDNDKTRVRPRAKTEVAESGKQSVLIITSVIALSLAGVAGWWFWPKPDIEPIQITQAPVAKPEPQITVTPPVMPEPTMAQKVDTKIASTEPEIDEIAQWLAKADDAIVASRLTSPENNNAYYYLQNILKREPENTEALSRMRDIANKYLTLSNARVAQKDYRGALAFVEKGLEVDSSDEALLTARENIKRLLEMSKPATKSYVTVIKPDTSAVKLSGTHQGANKALNFWYARQELVNQLYNKIILQCNNTQANFKNGECHQIYENYVRHWPIPLYATQYTEATEQELQSSKLTFLEGKARDYYQSELQDLLDKINNTTLKPKDTLLALTNYEKIAQITPLFGIKTEKTDFKKIAQLTSTIRGKLKPIKSVSEFANRVTFSESAEKIYLYPIINRQSLEVTPYAVALGKELKSLWPLVELDQASHYLLAEYDLRQDGNVDIDFWLMDRDNKIIDLFTGIIDQDLLGNFRKTNTVFNTQLYPTHLLSASYGFPSEIAMNDQTFTASLKIGQKTSLRVKLRDAGFYFIAVHVARKNEQYSYLLPLREGSIPFVQVTTRNQTGRFITLGEFEITPPAAVETLQLISAGINLEKYLPRYHWDETRQQFIIDGSIGNISAGITQVRDAASRISSESTDKRARWQERLLVTSIMD